jgi:hypothetical protein
MALPIHALKPPPSVTYGRRGTRTHRRPRLPSCPVAQPRGALTGARNQHLVTGRHVESKSDKHDTSANAAARARIGADGQLIANDDDEPCVFRPAHEGTARAVCVHRTETKTAFVWGRGERGVCKASAHGLGLCPPRASSAPRREHRLQCASPAADRFGPEVPPRRKYWICGLHLKSRIESHDVGDIRGKLKRPQQVGGSLACRPVAVRVAVPGRTPRVVHRSTAASTITPCQKESAGRANGREEHQKGCREETHMRAHAGH